MVLRLSIYSSSLPKGTQTIHYSLQSPRCRQTILLHIIVSLVALRLSHYSSQFPWWYSVYPYTYLSLTGGTQSIPLLITISFVELRQSLYSSQSPSWYSDYPFTHHSLPGGTQTIPLLITVYLVAQTSHILITVSPMVLRLSLYSSQSLWWYSDNPYTHHSLFGGPQSILSTSHSVWWYSEYPYTHHSLSGRTQNIPILIRVSLVVLRVSLYSPQSPWWYSDYPYTHQSLPKSTQTIPVLITVYLVAQTIPLLIIVSLVALRLSIHTSQSPRWYSEYPFTHHNLLG